MWGETGENREVNAVRDRANREVVVGGDSGNREVVVGKELQGGPGKCGDGFGERPGTTATIYREESQKPGKTTRQ